MNSRSPLHRGLKPRDTAALLIAFSRLVGAVTFSVALVAAGNRLSAAPDVNPNILIILVDDMGFSDIGCYGGEIPTPNLDALAANGARFSRFYNTGRCCPTRASLLTGVYPHQAGMGWMTRDEGAPGYRGQLNDRCVTIAEVLKPAGYFTAMTGKWHVGFEHGVTPSSRGFQRSLNMPAGGLHFWDQTGSKGGTKLYLDGVEIPRDDPRLEPPWYGADLWTEQGIRFIDEALAAGQPFFLYLAHAAPHFPCMAPEATIARYRGTYGEGWDVLRERRYERQIDLGLIDASWPLTPRPEEIPAWDSLSDAEKTRYDDMMAIYAAMIDEVDKNVGKLVAALRDRGQLDNTLILFLSDNGGNAESGVRGKHQGKHPGDAHSEVFIGQCWAQLNNTPFRKYKHYNHEGGVATPLIAHWPQVIPPRPGPNGWIDTPAHLIDLMATCVDISGASYPESVNDVPILPMEGVSLLPVLRGDGVLPPRTLYWEHEGNAAILSGNRKLVREGMQGAWELFDTRADRTEQSDLAADQADDVERLDRRWREWATRVHAVPKPVRAERQNKKQPEGGVRPADTVSADQEIAGAAAGLPAPKPLFTDPNHHGSCDPEIVWNPHEREWWIFYTARRALLESGSYVGTPIGVAASADLAHWRFVGYCTFDGTPGAADMPDTHWAPGIIRDGDTVHLFATYKDNANPPWGGKGVVRHYVAPVTNLLTGWVLADTPQFTGPDPIDASLIRVDGQFRAYYRVGENGGIQWATSPDLTNWTNQGRCPGDINAPARARGFGYQEAPYVFRFGGFYWMLTDPHQGLAVYRSDDAVEWRLQGRILETPGQGSEDATLARHPSVAVVNDRAFLFYHVEPNRPYPSPPPEKRTVQQKISFLQVAELEVDRGRLTCDRDAPVIIREPAAGTRWSAARANAWYAGVAWPVGANFIPSTAINPLEMWQADTFDPETIDRELRWAAAIGMNSMRVFLHDIPWREDAGAFCQRIDAYLTIAERHGIRTMFVLFDGVWNPEPRSGPQPDPQPRVHNSGWVQSPGKAILGDPARHDELQPYVSGILSRYGRDPRVLCWDLFNEPDNANGGNFGGGSTTPDLPAREKLERSADLLEKSFAWARAVNPTQPLTAGVWGKPSWLKTPDRIERISLEQSDVISFHSYMGPDPTRAVIEGLQGQGRPILCTEYMARGAGSTFERILPILAEHRVGAFNWGLVDGRSQTIYPWDSWNRRYTAEPDPWFHDVFRRDGAPYREEEVRLIRQLTRQHR